jgi:hypothetical protein
MILSIALYAIMLRNDTQHNTLYDIMVSVVMLNVVAPYGPGLIFESMDA